MRMRNGVRVELPKNNGTLSQDEEYCWVIENGTRRRIRFHDYGEVFSVPGLYEHLFHTLLRCQSPQKVVSLLSTAVRDDGGSLSDLRALDLGAGNGIVAENLAREGVDYIVGVDIIEEAASAARRDRPNLYEEYLVGDVRDPSLLSDLAIRDFNCLTCVAALGFDDIPASVFHHAYKLVSRGGWLAFNVKCDFLDRRNGEFGPLLAELLDTVEIRSRERYCHRYSVDGRALYYDMIVGKKKMECEIVAQAALA